MGREPERADDLLIGCMEASYEDMEPRPLKNGKPLVDLLGNLDIFLE